LLTAILSDIHGNRQALEAVHSRGQELDVDTWICLGDIVGYGGAPNFCIETVRALTNQVVLGNHDAAAVGRLDPYYFNDYARRAVLWTAAQLTEEENAYLAGLPLTLDCDDALCVHAEPCQPEQWCYVQSRQEARSVLDNMDHRLCFIGHTHVPFICAHTGGKLQMTGPQENIAIEADGSYLVNVGSVGQPRDGDPRACFLLWDQLGNTLELIRTDYDIAAAQETILDAGLPSFLAQRLAIGQ
jgi:diadenosine tetraphosphatase ApaH/serine/threonine PP2A family protein phosphatase